MPTVTIDAEVDLSDIDNDDFIKELGERIRGKSFSEIQVKQLNAIVGGQQEIPIAMVDFMLYDQLAEAQKKYSTIQIIEKLK